MHSIRRILVAVKDPSAKSLPAVAKAAQLARALDAEIQLFHSIADPIYLDARDFDGQSLPQFEHRQRAQYRDRLEAVAKRLRRMGLQVTTAVEWDFPVYEAILRSSLKFKADLIVAECHAGRHLAAGLLRLTDWELLRHSAVPVLLVKNSRAYRRPKVLAAVDPQHAFAKPANLDAEILRCGSTIAQALHGALHVVHAYDPVPLGLAMSPAQLSVPNVVPRIRKIAAAQASAALERTLTRAHMPSVKRHVVARHPIDAVQDMVRETGSSIVVMGAISRSGLKHVFFGNTAERLLDRLACDILVVKPKHFRSPIARKRQGARLMALPISQPPF